MNYIARITWVRYTEAVPTVEREEDCAIFETRDEAERHLCFAHADPDTKPGWSIDETRIDEEEE